MTKQTAQDLSDLVATKGAAAPPANTPGRSATRKKPTEPNNAPLNFRVTADLKRRFRMLAAQRDLKLSELLRLAFEEYEAKHSRQANKRPRAR